MQLSERQRQRRVQELREIARILSCGGEEDAKHLISDAAGSFNLTTISIGAEVGKLRKNNQMSDGDKNKIKSLLSHVKAAGARGDANKAGCFFGKKIWRSTNQGSSKCVKKKMRRIKINHLEMPPEEPVARLQSTLGRFLKSGLFEQVRLVH